MPERLRTSIAALNNLAVSLASEGSYKRATLLLKQANLVMTSGRSSKEGAVSFQNHESIRAWTPDSNTSTVILTPTTGGRLIPIESKSNVLPHAAGHHQLIQLGAPVCPHLDPDEKYCKAVILYNTGINLLLLSGHNKERSSSLRSKSIKAFQLALSLLLHHCIRDCSCPAYRTLVLSTAQVVIDGLVGAWMQSKRDEAAIARAVLKLSGVKRTVQSLLELEQVMMRSSHLAAAA